MDSANLDFMRANAVLMVLAFHVLGFFGIRRIGSFDLQAMGLLGVLLFFVHTSFVLMLSLERQLAKFGRERLFLIFIVRRCFRIYPLSILVVALVAVFKLPLAGPPWGMHWSDMGASDILSNLLLVQNVAGSSSIPAPLWSLPFEMQMYLFLPALFLLARRVKSSLALAGGVLLLVALFLLRVDSGHGYYLKYFPCFLPGIVAYKLSLRRRFCWPSWSWMLLLWSAAAVFMLLGTLETGWLICFIVGTAIPQFAELSNPWLERAAHLVARYSYGLYLTHYACLWLAFTKLGFFHRVAQWAIFTVAVTMCPILLYHFFELPLIKVGRKLAEGRLASSRMEALAGRAA
jgi:peptidoglycan/LPS O-acetylase OafA/YrhL